jgi:hypothetical protein
MEVLKLPKLELPQLHGAIILCANFRLGWSLEQSCIPRWELSNSVLHATCTQGNQVDSWFFVVGSQIANLIRNLSFSHNLCFKCPNGSCEPILDIYVSITFQWYKELFKAMGFAPWNCIFKIWKFTEIPIPKVGVPLGVWRFIPSHSLALLGACGMTLDSPFAHNLATPCLGRKPKARVVTCYYLILSFKDNTLILVQ